MALACPNGIPYQPHVRSNVIALHKAGLSNAAIAHTFLDRPCERTVQEWVQRYKRDPEHRVPEPLPLLGGVPMLSQEAAYGLWVLKCAMPALSAVAAQQFITLVYNMLPSAATISREVKRRLCMSRKKIEHVSQDRNEPDRVDFWDNDPLDEVRPGVAGVLVENLVSLDEKTLTFAECQAQYGHSPVGLPCVRSGPAPSSQQSYNVILAVDVRVGCICYLIYRGTLDRDTFYCWVALQVSLLFMGTRCARCCQLESHSYAFALFVCVLLVFGLLGRGVCVLRSFSLRLLPTARASSWQTTTRHTTSKAFKIFFS
jgi:hypothetical protein